MYARLTSIIAILPLFFGSCSVHDDCAPAADGNFEARFTVRTVASNNKVTRGIGTTEENAAGDLYLLVFDAADKYLYYKKATGVYDTAVGGGEKTARFSFDRTDNVAGVKLVFISGSGLAGVLDGIAAGSAASDVRRMPMLDCGAGWNASSPTDFTPIPMWGAISGTVTVTEGDTGLSVRMIRALARVNVTLGGGLGIAGYTLASVDIYNPRPKGYIWPLESNIGASQTAVNPTVDEATPVSGTAATYAAGGSDSFAGEIYIAETDNPPSARISLVVGLVNGESGLTEYFRLGFVGDARNFLPVLRNHSYTFNITGINGLGGYPDKTAALGGAEENLVYELNVIDDSYHNLIVTDEHHILCVNSAAFTLTGAGIPADLVVYTDCPSGWSVDPASVRIDGTDSTWPTDLSVFIKGTANECYAGRYDCNHYLDITAASSIVRQVTFDLKAGERLRKTITIDQR